MDLITLAILVLCGIAAYGAGYAHGHLNATMYHAEAWRRFAREQKRKEAIGALGKAAGVPSSNVR